MSRVVHQHERVVDAAMHPRRAHALGLEHRAEHLGHASADALVAALGLRHEGERVEHEAARLRLPEHAEDAAALNGAAARLQQRAEAQHLAQHSIA